MSRHLRVLVADDNQGAREALSSVVESEEGLEVAAAAADVAEAIALSEREQPEVAIIDVRIPGGGCVAAVRGIAACSPRTKMITLSASVVAPSMDEPAVVGHLIKGDPIESIIASVRRAAEG
jgi:DNA-binding NarL/FixJ family response regulator